MRSNKDGAIDGVEFSIGQGLSKEQVKTIAFIANSGTAYGCTFSDSCKIGLQFSNQLVHKCNTKNTMISIPEEDSEKIYKSYLLIDEECAEMSDHITGSHVQGMVLIEAARQMISAVSEKFLVQDKRCNYFVLNGINAQFKQYIFPIEVEILHKVVDIRYGLRGAYSATSEIHFIQNGVLALTIEAKHQAMDTVAMDNYESNLATQCIDAGLSKRQAS